MINKWAICQEQFPGDYELPIHDYYLITMKSQEITSHLLVINSSFVKDSRPGYEPVYL